MVNKVAKKHVALEFSFDQDPSKLRETQHESTLNSMSSNNLHNNAMITNKLPTFQCSLNNSKNMDLIRKEQNNTNTTFKAGSHYATSDEQQKSGKMSKQQGT